MVNYTAEVRFGAVILILPIRMDRRLSLGKQLSGRSTLIPDAAATVSATRDALEVSSRLFLGGLVSTRARLRFTGRFCAAPGGRNRQPPPRRGWGIFDRRNGEISTGVDKTSILNRTKPNPRSQGARIHYRRSQSALFGTAVFRFQWAYDLSGVTRTSNTGALPNPPCGKCAAGLPLCGLTPRPSELSSSFRPPHISRPWVE